MEPGGLRVYQGDTLQEAFKVAKEDLGRMGELENFPAKLVPVEGRPDDPARVLALPLGSACVFEGRVYIADPPPGGEQPRLAAGANLRVLLNGRPLVGEEAVGEADRIELEPEYHPPAAKLVVKLAADKMAAGLRLEQVPGRLFKVINRPPAPVLLLEAEVTQVLEPPVPSVTEALAALREGRVSEGLDYAAVSQALEGGGQEVLVARGVPPQPGRDAVVEPLYREGEPASPAEQEDVGGRVDLRPFRSIASARPGQAIARRLPPQPGKAGRDVTGGVVAPAPVRDLSLKAGQGVELRGDGNLAVATISGRPEIQGALVMVKPLYLINGDADTKEGHIRFSGDIMVKGNVLDGLTVEAGGLIEVQGYVANAVLVAGGAVKVRQNLLGSQVRAGATEVLYQRLASGLKGALELVEHLMFLTRQVSEGPAFREVLARRGDALALKVVVEGKLPEAPRQMLGYQAEVGAALAELEASATDLNPAGLQLVKERLERLATLLQGPRLLRLNDLIEFSGPADAFCQQAREQIELLQVLAERRSDLTAAYAQNCRLEASGRVQVIGKGCLNTFIRAGQEVVVNGVPGLFAGGFIEAGADVTVRRLGTMAEAPTGVEVPRGAVIRAGEAYAGVRLKAGARSEHLQVTTKNLVFTS